MSTVGDVHGGAIEPCVKVLLELARAWRLAGVHTAFAYELELVAEKYLKYPLRMNVDGVIGVLICDLEIDPTLGKAFFIIGRFPGYVAYVHE